ncbi:methionyl-tRNA formyltransferase [Agaribacterium sp. ZY112]|uniref:methionyl-tRNA formyltransferase n=1 Tax=Agaribacterium sp. ZY112 TaxID=3233574 RepID=UPI003524611C
MALNIIFAGTPVFAERHLDALIKSEHNIVAVYSQPDRPAGRGKKLTASPVKQLALQHEIPVLQPLSLKTEDAQQELNNFDADLMVVVAYGLILPQAVLDSPRFGCLNVHGSILPRWRGAAPIQRAIEAGDHESGVTIMQMDEGLDTGAMLLKKTCSISATETSASLHDKLADIGPQALLETINAIETKTLNSEAQDDSLSNYAAKIEKSEAQISWQEDAQLIDRRIRAFVPFPVCYSELAGQRFKIHKAKPSAETVAKRPGELKLQGQSLFVQCGKGSLELITVQAPGKKAMPSQDWLNGLGFKLPANEFDS